MHSLGSGHETLCTVLGLGMRHCIVLALGMRHYAQSWVWAETLHSLGSGHETLCIVLGLGMRHYA